MVFNRIMVDNTWDPLPLPLHIYFYLYRYRQGQAIMVTIKCDKFIFLGKLNQKQCNYICEFKPITIHLSIKSHSDYNNFHYGSVNMVLFQNFFEFITKFQGKKKFGKFQFFNFQNLVWILKTFLKQIPNKNIYSLEIELISQL